MEKKQFVKELSQKDNVDTFFLVKYIASMAARDGREYLNVVLADSSGDIEARKWHGAEKVISEIKRGEYVSVKGKVNQYQGRLQLIVSEIFKVDESGISFDDFISKSDNDSEKMFDQLVGIIDTINDVYIKDLLRAILFDSTISCRLKLWPAGKSIHHAYQAGLLEHLLSCARMASFMSEQYKVNRDFVVAGAIMHDLCKIFEIGEAPLYDYTEEGKLIGHVMKVVELLDHFAGKIKNFPQQTRIHLKHILISHHGEVEYGSPKVPQTSEALLVHHIDLIDSKMNSFETAKKSDNNAGNWTGYIKHLDRIVYKRELQSFGEYLKIEDSVSDGKDFKEKSCSSVELKHNMSEMLKNFKV